MKISKGRKPFDLNESEISKISKILGISRYKEWYLIKEKKVLRGRCIERIVEIPKKRLKKSDIIVGYRKYKRMPCEMAFEIYRNLYRFLYHEPEL